MPKMKRSEYLSFLKRLIRLWQMATSVEDVASKLKISKTQLEVTVLKLRRHGVELKKMPRATAGRKFTAPKLKDRHWDRLAAYVTLQETV